LEELIRLSSENTHDVRENAFSQELKAQRELLEHELREERRLLNALPVAPPMTFGLGSRVLVRYLNEDIPEFTVVIVEDNVIPDVTKDITYISVHAPLAKTIYGKIGGEYRVVVKGVVHNVEVAFA